MRWDNGVLKSWEEREVCLFWMNNEFLSFMCTFQSGYMSIHWSAERVRRVLAVRRKNFSSVFFFLCYFFFFLNCFLFCVFFFFQFFLSKIKLHKGRCSRRSHFTPSRVFVSVFNFQPLKKKILFVFVKYNLQKFHRCGIGKSKKGKGCEKAEVRWFVCLRLCPSVCTAIFEVTW